MSFCSGSKDTNIISPGSRPKVPELTLNAVFPTPVMGEQVVAANFDYVFIMMSLNNDFNINRVERYLTAAWQSGGVPVIILTKVDIAEDKKSLSLRQIFSPPMDLIHPKL